MTARSVLALACIVFATCTQASGATGWSKPETLGSLPQDWYFYVGYRHAAEGDGNGNAVAVWQETPRGIATAFRDARGHWTRAPLLQGTGGDDSTLAVNRSGAAVLVTGTKVIRVRTARLPNPIWSPASTIGRGAVDVALAGIDDAGRITLVWETHRRSEVMAVRGSFGSSHWSKPRAISPRGGEGPQLVVDPTTGATVSWARCMSRDHCSVARMDSPFPHAYRLEARHVGPDGRWGRVETAMASVGLQNGLGTQLQHALVRDADGGATLIWTQNGSFDRLLAVRRDPGSGKWSGPTVIADLGEYSWQSPDGAIAGGKLRVATNTRGDAAVTWTATHVSGVRNEIGLAQRRGGDTRWDRVLLAPDIQSALGLPDRLALAEDGRLYFLSAVRRVVPGQRDSAAIRVGSEPAGDTHWSVSELTTSANPRAESLGLVVGPGTSALAVWAIGSGPGIVEASAYPGR